RLTPLAAANCSSVHPFFRRNSRTRSERAAVDGSGAASAAGTAAGGSGGRDFLVGRGMYALGRTPTRCSVDQVSQSAAGAGSRFAVSRGDKTSRETAKRVPASTANNVGLPLYRNTILQTGTAFVKMVDEHSGKQEPTHDDLPR